MSARNKAWAKRDRAAMVAELGGKCAKCGSSRQLELDCITPQGARHHKFDTGTLASFYNRQHALGNVQLLCKTCNASKGATADKKRHGWPI